MNTMLILTEIINPTLKRLALEGIPPSDEARALLYAIGLQESKLTYRYQIISGGGKGPARGLWQFERCGGVSGVLTHKATAGIANKLAVERGCAVDPKSVWERLESDDILACVFARLLLLPDPKPLPIIFPASEKYAWEYYLRCWRPGKPHPDVWPGNWNAALAAVKAAS